MWSDDMRRCAGRLAGVGCE
jgi:hypothetical protein